MKIGIDVSQIVHEKTGVSRYVTNMVRTLLHNDTKNDYVLFGSSLRKRKILEAFIKKMQCVHPRTQGMILPLPPVVLDFFWNRLHIFPVQWFIGNIDIFWSSDWTQPPVGNAKGVTTVHDLSFHIYPNETHSQIRAVHERRMKHALNECDVIFCDSISTKKDIFERYPNYQGELHVIYPGYI